MSSKPEAHDTNTEAIYAEYPFLHRWAPRTSVRAAFVKRWDAAFLKLRAGPDSANSDYDGPHYRSRHSDPNGDPIYYNISTIYLLDSEGNKVGQVANWYRRVEPVEYALHRIGNAVRRIKYAVAIEDGKVITLYKVPKGFDNAAEWLAADIESERERIREI